MKHLANAYTYLVSHKITKQYYYGVRWGNKVPPEQDLWIEYFTSSERVKDLIDQYGADSFDTQVRKVFNNEIAAINWETKVLRRMKVLENKDIWLNRNAGGAILIDEKAREKLEAYWNDPEVKKWRSERVKGDKNPSKLPEVRKKMKKSLREKRKKAKEEGTIWYSEEYRKKMSESTSGAGNGRARKYLLTDPNGKEHIVHGTLKNFCRDNGLSSTWAKKQIENKNENPGIEGWSIKELDSAQAGKNRVHINNGVEQKMCFLEDLPKMLEQGWMKGFIKRERKKRTPEQLAAQHRKSLATLEKKKAAGWVNPTKGRPVSAERLAKMRETAKKRRGKSKKMTAEGKAAISAANRLKAKAKKLTGLPNNFDDVFEYINENG